MSKKNYHIVSKNIDLLNKRGYTNFLSPLDFIQIKNKIKNCKIYHSFIDCEKVIIYNSFPKVSAFEIISYNHLTHSQIMGSLYNLSIESDMFGDIIIKDGKYYVIVLSKIKDILINEFKIVNNSKIELKEVSIKKFDNYKMNYINTEIIVSSLRIDTVISKIICISRDKVKQFFKNDMIYLNYNLCNDANKKITTGDIFSIRRHGKYKFDRILKKTKKGGYIILLKKYS